MNQRKYRYENKDINKVLMYQKEEIESFERIDLSETEKNIKETEELLESLGVGLPSQKPTKNINDKKVVSIPSWDELLSKAEEKFEGEVALESLFTPEELDNNRLALIKWEDEFNAIHKLDKNDIAISAIAATVGAAIEIFLVGIPHKTKTGLKAGPLSNYIRDWFDKKFPEEEMQKLANSKISKVPFDAQDNRNTKIQVEGLSSYYHRLFELGHDPILGFIFGVFDIMTGSMTTIDRKGKIIRQTIDVYRDRKESNIFLALAKQVAHLKSDVTTSMGLPVPLMALLNLLQIGSIGKEEQTIAEIVQGMYYEGYDFIHFCSMSIPVVVTEVIVRLLYAIKRIKEGCSIKDSIPLTTDRQKHPKLATMLFIAHSGATAINLGKILFAQNPLAINYPQWLAVGKYTYQQLIWGLIEKPLLQYHFIEEKIEEELKDIYGDIDSLMEEMSDSFIFVEE